jgi:DNA polymerase III subunit gamma/tau
MSYQVIARKWRPQTFEEVTGQETVTRTLRNAVEHERLHHAYLFSGARGVGKTTTARLLAKALNCHKTQKPNPNPCSPAEPDACASCREIAEGRSIDVLEFDAASNTQVDKIRDLIIENINIAPARDRFKVFIIDEVHMLSTSSFNALLKTLEEPPPNVTFIMATTELHKVPDTILSRCQEFEFRTIPTAKIFDRLRLIADAEKINIADDALREIARSGEGSMRDAQSNFDQVISFSGEKIGTEDVINALGIASSEMLTRTVRAIAENKPSDVLAVVEELIRRGQDLRNFCRDLLAFFRDLLVAKVSDAEELLDSAAMNRAELLKRAEAFSEADLIRFFQSLSDTETKLRAATEPRYILEIGLIKLLEMRRVTPVEQLLERLAKLEAALADGNFPPPSEKKTEPLDLTNATTEKKTFAPEFLSEVPFPVKPVESREPRVESDAGKFQISDFKLQKEEPSIVMNGSLPAQSAAVSVDLSVANAPSANADWSMPPAAAGAFYADEKKSDDIIKPLGTLDSALGAKREQNNFAAQIADFLETAPLKLPPISSEELEHIEDKSLDDAFEEKLLREGDDLSQIKNAQQIVADLFGANSAANGEATRGEPAASNGAAAAKAPIFVPPIYENGLDDGEIPVLPENPTEEQLWEFARNHPLVKKVRWHLKADIVEVWREGHPPK